MTFESPPLTLAAIPAISAEVERSFSKRTPLTRRSFGQKAGMAAVGLGLAYVGLVSRATRAGAVADGGYWREWGSPTTGPCAPGGYAANHGEEGRKCGPSAPCWTDLACCLNWTYAQPPAPGGNKQANVHNAHGWHLLSYSASGTEYRQRPDECFASASGSHYDSWQWTTNGTTWGCSDGITIPQTGSPLNSICPWDAADPNRNYYP